MNGKDEYELNLVMLFKTLLRRLPIILLVSVITAVFAFFHYRTPVQTSYVGKCAFYVPTSITVSEKQGQFDEFSSHEETTTAGSMNNVDTCCYLVTTPSVLDAVISHADLPYSVKELSQIVTAKQENPKAYAFTVQVKSKEESEALHIAQAFANSIPEILINVAPNAQLRVLDEGSVSVVSSGGNNIKKTIQIALIAAFVSASICALVFVFKDLTGNSGILSSEIKRYYPENRILTSFASSQDYNAINRLRSNLFLALPQNEKCHVIGLTGVKGCLFKDDLALHLADSLAETGDQVLLVDADFHSNNIQKLASIDSHIGLSDIIRNADFSVISFQIIKNGDYSFSVIPVGDNSAISSELVDCRKLLPAINKLKEQYNWIIINLETIGISIDAASIGKELDGVLVTVREEGCTLNEFLNCMSQLEFASANVIGYVLYKSRYII